MVVAFTIKQEFNDNVAITVIRLCGIIADGIFPNGDYAALCTMSFYCCPTGDHHQVITMHLLVVYTQASGAWHSTLDVFN